MMSGLEVMGIYLLGVILGGLLGLMIARRLYGRRMPDPRPQRLIARLGQRFRRASRSGSPGAERSGKSRETEEEMVRREVRPETPDAMRRVPDPDRVAGHGQEEAPRSFSRPQPQRKPWWNARWLTRRTVEAEEFVVRDSTGMRRAKLGMSRDGWVRLHLFDEDGERCVSLGVAPDGHPRLCLYDQAGNPRMTCSLLDGWAADLRILDKDGDVLWKAP